MTSSHPAPHYRFEDTARLLAAAPLAALARPREALRFLQHQLETMTELEAGLARYPEVRYEPLDFVYVTLQSLGALDEHLVEDLTRHYGWRGVVWASLLTMLSPQPEFGAALRAARGQVPHNVWAVDLALAALGEPVPKDLEQLHAVLQALKGVVSRLARPMVRLTRAEPLEDVQARALRVAEAYRQGGLSAALSARNAEEPTSAAKL